MNERTFQKKLEAARKRAAQRIEETTTRSPFGSWSQFMTPREKSYVANAQSRAMKKWWKALPPAQRLEMGRRIREGLLRANAQRDRTKEPA
jgi:hypothetical protein